MRNLFCHSNPVPRIGTTIAAALLSLAALTACGEAGALEPLDRWRDGEREIRTTAPAVTAGRTLLAAGDYGNFRLTGEALTQPGAQAALLFHTDGESGYEVVFRNGAIDGTRKSGSLASVRNLYRSLADDGEWFGFEVTVRGRNIVVRIDTTEVVCYTEPEHPYRTQAHARQLLGHGAIALRGVQEDHSFVLTNAGEKENDRVKAIKRMLTGIMLMLMAISFAVGNGDRGTWLGGAAFILLPIAVAVFVGGLFTEEEK